MMDWQNSEAIQDAINDALSEQFEKLQNEILADLSSLKVCSAQNISGYIEVLLDKWTNREGKD